MKPLILPNWLRSSTTQGTIPNSSKVDHYTSLHLRRTGLNVLLFLMRRVGRILDQYKGIIMIWAEIFFWDVSLQKFSVIWVNLVWTRIIVFLDMALRSCLNLLRRLARFSFGSLIFLAFRNRRRFGCFLNRNNAFRFSFHGFLEKGRRLKKGRMLENIWNEKSQRERPFL